MQAFVVEIPSLIPSWLIVEGLKKTRRNLTYLFTYNLASLSGPNSAWARTQLTLSLMKQFRSNRLTLH